MLTANNTGERWDMSLSQIELLPLDPIAREPATEEIRKKYSQYFGI